MDLSALITISIPAFRRPSLILQTLQSCLNQDYRPLEIDIGDDSPSDETEQSVQSFALPDGITLRYWRNRPSLGQAANVNSLLDVARGRRWVLLHDDDALMPGAISSMAKSYDSAEPDVVAAYGFQRVILENGELSQLDTDLHNHNSNRFLNLTGVQRSPVVCALWRQFPNNGYLVETKAARETKYRSFEEIGHACDADFGLRLAMNCNERTFSFIEPTTSIYRLSSNAISRTQDNISWKFYNYIIGLTGLKPDEEQARTRLLRKIAQKAVLENALAGRRKAALSIFVSPYYPRTQDVLRSIYHLALMAVPQAALLRRMQRA